MADNQETKTDTDVKPEKTEGKKQIISKGLMKNIIIMGMAVVILLIMMFTYYLPGSKDSGLGNVLFTLEETSLNWRFAAKAFTSGARVTASGVSQTAIKEGWYKKIYIAAIDEDAIDEWGLPPFDRSVYAEIVNNIGLADVDRQPSAIFFDVVFDTYRDADSDQMLAESFENYPGVIGEDIILDLSRGTVSDYSAEDVDLIIEHREKLYMQDSLDYYADSVQAIKRFELSDDNFDMDFAEKQKIFQFNVVMPMIPELAENLTFIGAANIDQSGVTVRKKPLVFSAVYYIEEDDGSVTLTNIYYPDVVLALAVQLYESDMSNVVISPGEVVIKNAVIKEFDDFGNVIESDPPLVQDISIPVDERFRMAINYKAAQSYDYVNNISLRDVSRMSEDPDRYGLPSDVVLMIGVYSLGLTGREISTDIWRSPLGDMYGILHLSYGLGTIMNQDFINELPDWISIIYTIITVLAIAFLISRGIKWTMMGGLIGVVLPLFLGFFLFQFHIDIVMMVPLISGAITLIAGEIYMLLTEEKEKRFIKNTFSSYVNPDLVDILIQNPEMMGLGGVSKDLSILFSDIRGFTTISESMDSEYLIGFLNDYLTRMTDIVMESKGTLDKYIGDAVMAFWGAPIDLPNNALTSCKAAVVMMEALKEFNEDRAKLGDKPIDIGIGINSASVSVGNVGSEVRKNYTVIGDGVNLASRLEGANKFYATHIIISEYTYEKVKDKVIARELDKMTVKGKNLPVKIYELWDVIEDE